MFKKVLFTAVTGMIISFGIAGSAWSEPDGSQLLRGLGGRTFAVQVTNLTGGGPPLGTFSNCYIFNEDGSWIDPQFPPSPGTWIQDSTGAKTSYSASALFDLGGDVGVLIEQNGTVTPAKGKGTLQLEAFSYVSIVMISDGSLLLKLDDFYSVGYQDNDCS